MYIFKNALVSISRNKGRNILIGIIIFVIGICATITLAIRSSAETLITSYTDAYKVEATISVNRDNLMQNFDPSQGAPADKTSVMEKFNEASNITVEDVENYGDSSYVANYYYTLNAKVDSETITAATSDIPGKGGHGMMDTGSSFTITGYSSLESMTEFIAGTYTITDGEVSTNFSSNDCVINSELATTNDIKVGDTITFENPDDNTKTYKLVVTGIYSDNEESGEIQMFSNSANIIITNANFVKNMASIDETVSPTFILESKDAVESFTNEVKEKGLDNMLTITTNLSQVESETKSISNLKTYATTFLIVTFIIGAVILFVINMINVRERKYEIGVLRTIGMKKSEVTMQFVFETLIIALFALVLGAGIGSVVSVPVANSMLQSEIEESATNMNNIDKNFGGNINNNMSNGNQMKMQGAVNVDKITSINAAVNITVLLQLLLVGVCLTVISSLASMISIQRFRPLTILKERS